MRQNVLQLIGSFHQGGSERQAVQLCRLLSNEASFNVFAATLDSSGSLKDEIDALDLGEIPEFKLTSFYDANFLKQARRFAVFIQKNKIDLVHTHDFYTNIFGMTAAFLARDPVRIASKRETLSKSQRQFFIERQAFRLAHKITANSGAVRDFLVEKGVPADKIATIYNGLDPDRVKPPRDFERSSALKKFGLPEERGLKFVTLVANLRSEVKNHRMFLRGAALILKNAANTRFVAAGEGELSGDLIKFSEDLGLNGKVYFPGRCGDVGSLLAISDVCVLTSRSEGFSNSILEYMAAGKPVVATDVGGAREALVDGETGFLVASDDHEEFAERVLELLTDEKKAAKMGDMGRQRTAEEFSPKTQLAKTLELYRSVLDSSRRH